ncbi:MAG: O-antigen ligase family protein [Anaerovibrio sp.]|nr:O-antigen ligase family protein [Anaerovibrio sp.]
MTALRRFASSRGCKDLIVMSIAAEAFFLALCPIAAEIALLFGFAVFLFRWKLDKNFHYRKTPVFGAVLAFMLCGAASIYASPDRGFSFYNWYNLALVYCMTFILVVQNVTTKGEVKYIAYALGLSALLVVAYGFFQLIFGIDTSEMKWVDGEAFPELRNRVFSTWENPNILAAYLDAVICVLLGFFVRLEERRVRLALGAAMLACLVCLAMTYARGAFLTVVLILGGYGVLKDKRILLMLLVVIGGILFLDPVLLERMKTAFSVMDTSSEMRIAMWESTLQMIMDHPLLGIGWGAYWMVYPLYDTYIVDGSVTLVHAHNIYLNYWAETGLIGGTAFFIYFFRSMGTALFNQRVLPNRFLEGLLLGLGLALLSVALNGMTDDVLFNMPSSMLLWMMCGLVFVIIRL